MIYWERVNPSFSVTLEAPSNWQGLVYRNIDLSHEWVTVQGRIPLWWSDLMSPQQAAHVIRSNMLIGCDYLVIYGSRGPDVQFTLLRGFNFPLCAEGPGVEPPSWWNENPLVARLLHVNGRITLLREAFRRRETSSRGAGVEGYCPQCGLPEGKHVAHDPPGVAPGLNYDKVEAWLYALSRHYGQALKQLTDEELLKMPDIQNIRRLRLIAHEIGYRLKKPPLPKDATIPSVWDRLTGEPSWA